MEGIEHTYFNSLLVPGGGGGTGDPRAKLVWWRGPERRRDRRRRRRTLVYTGAPSRSGLVVTTVPLGHRVRA
jgi:hypothetical protein